MWLDDLKYIAKERDVPYPSPVKIYVAERVEEELKIDEGMAKKIP
jgi:hypothetical protein